MNKILSHLVMGLSLAAMPLLAQGPHPGRGPGMGHEFVRPFKGLNLTEAQKTSLKDVAEKHKAALKTKRDAVQEAHKTLQKAMVDPAAKEADLKVLHDSVSQAQFAMMLERRTMMLESEALLTPEQKAQWEKMRAERREHPFGPGRGPGHGPGPGKHRGHGPADSSDKP